MHNGCVIPRAASSARRAHRCIYRYIAYFIIRIFIFRSHADHGGLGARLRWGSKCVQARAPFGSHDHVGDVLPWPTKPGGGTWQRRRSVRVASDPGLSPRP